MDFDEDNSKELWEWQKEEYCPQSDANTTYCPWEDLEQKEDGLLYTLGEKTPIKDCADLGYLISYNEDDESKGVDEHREFSQLKRRRMLQYSSTDTDVIINDELLASEFMKSKIGEDSLMKDETNDDLQWILGLSDSQDGPDQSSEGWLTSCFNESEMDVRPEQMNVSDTSFNNADGSARCNVPRQMRTLKLPVTISITPRNKLRGSRPYMSTPPKMASSVAYPFALIKPCGVQGDTTLKDINRRIHSPFLLKEEQAMGEDPLQCYPTSAFSGKPVVVKTKIRTEGGKGSITIMRTKG